MQQITYGIFDTQFGRVIIGKTPNGLCWLGWMKDGHKGDGLERIQRFYPNATLTEDMAALKPMMTTIIQAWENDNVSSIIMDYTGTPFQKSVWNALLSIKKGNICTYGDIASAIGKPSAARAVGTAVGENPISLLIPCHRVLPASGGVGSYGWGPDIKEKLLQMENAPITVSKKK